MKRRLLAIFNLFLFIICFLFSISSFFWLLSFTPIEEAAYQNGNVMVMVFIIGIPISLVIAHHLNRLFQVLRLPLAEWKNYRLK